MKNKSVAAGIILFSFFLISSCSKEGPMGPEGPAGPSAADLTGSLVGFVTIYDEFGVAVADKSGVTITVDGTTPPLTATTNTNGKYQIDNLPTGTWDLVFSKTGCATYKSLGFSFVGGVKPRVFNMILSQLTSTLITNLDVSQYSATQMSINLTISPATPAGYYRYIRFYYSKNNPVTSTNYLSTSYLSTTSASLVNYLRSFDKATFPTGTTMYMVAYGESYYSYGYQDLTSGLYNYTTVNATGSNIVSVDVP
jgi:hypothetical protein